MSIYNLNNASASVEAEIKRRPNSFHWGIQGYRPDHSQMIDIIQTRNQNKSAFIEGNSAKDEVRWLALYCSDEIFTMQFLMEKTGLRRKQLNSFCAHYNVDLKRRNLVGGLN